MASLIRTGRRLLIASCTPSTGLKNGMSWYAPYYVDPVFKKEKIEQLIETGEVEAYESVPVKPPHPDQSCSSFQDEKVRKFTNIVMEMGKKQLARNLMEKTFENIKRTQIERYHLAPDAETRDAIELDPVKILHAAVENCRPIVDLMPVKRGGAKYQVPVPVREKRSYFISMRWLIESAQDKFRTVHFPEQLAGELLDAADNRGRVVKKKQDLHKQCEANRAYAHYRWS